MSYRSLPGSRDARKRVHLMLHGVALVLGAVGIYAVFKFHNESNIPNMYSLHSWVGMGTFCLYGIQVHNFCNTKTVCIWYFTGTTLHTYW
jgi:cytochrome b-561